LNRASSPVAFEALRTGVSLLVKDPELYWDYLSRVSFDAMDFFDTVDEYWAIRERSLSLSRTDRQRLMRHVSFLEKELKEKGYFERLDWSAYENDGHKRRDVERWVENIVNCSIDIAKIILASDKKEIPDSYKGMLGHLGLYDGLGESVASALAANAGLRNILAHEYLDMRFRQIRRFIDGAEKLYESLLVFVRGFLNV
jgi:uncharacterized protein YutE (UPF0331/DUF86 family)